MSASLPSGLGRLSSSSCANSPGARPTASSKVRAGFRPKRRVRPVAGVNVASRERAAVRRGRCRMCIDANEVLGSPGRKKKDESRRALPKAW